MTTTDTKLTAAEIRARRAAEEAVLRAEQAELRAAARAEQRGREAALPQVPWEPEPAIEPGVSYVAATEQVWAFDTTTRQIRLACVPGEWLRPEYARALGVDGPEVVLSQVPTGRVTGIGGGA